MLSKVTGLIPSQCACLGVSQVPSWEHARGNPLMLLSFFLSLPSPLSKNKKNKIVKKFIIGYFIAQKFTSFMPKRMHTYGSQKTWRRMLISPLFVLPPNWKQPSRCQVYHRPLGMRTVEFHTALWEPPPETLSPATAGTHMKCWTKHFRHKRAHIMLPFI